MLETPEQYPLFWPFMGMISAVVTGGVLIFCAACKRIPPNYPPGKYGMPVFGVLPLLGSHGQLTIKKWSLEKFGPIFYIKNGNHHEISLNTIETIKEALLDNDDVTSGRPNYYIFDQKVGVTFVDDGRFFREQKKFGTDFLHAMACDGILEKIINSEAELFVENISQTKEAIDLSNSTYVLSGNILSQILIGRRFAYDEENSYLTLLKNRYDGRHKQVAAITLLPWLRYFPPISTYYAASQARKRVLEEMLLQIIKEHEDNFKEDNLIDFIDHFIKEQRSGENSKERGFTRKQLESFIGDSLSAGPPNTSISLLWMILCAFTFPEFHKQLVEEIDNVLGKTQKARLEDRLKLPFTLAFMDEVWRFITPIRNSISRKTNAELKIKEFVLPPNTRMYGNFWGAHHDPETWPNPEKFDPYRHLDEDRRYIPSPNLIPLGIGARSCLGEYAAKSTIFLVFVKLLQGFTLEPSGLLPRLDQGNELITFDPLPFKVVLKKRQ